MALPLASFVPPAWTAQSISPDAVTCITKASVPERRLLLDWSTVEPNNAPPENEPVTKAPPTVSDAIPAAWSGPVPPAWTAQSMAPIPDTRITKASQAPRFVSDVEPNVTAPQKEPVTREPDEPSSVIPVP